ncbi:hypothetical protein JKF63_06838 [Porcisia hertigi]|uniref:Uncharacterized protein n=1 Tax=Porcisia hertigi TaxID=2761500 RepID=A0A837A909_9TRYP|nr:hypothetical protein JKF63_06838 [Porcisia hertigi]
MPATPPASVERVVVATSGAATATTPNTPWITQTLSHSQSNIDLTTATTGGALKPVERILADGCAKVGDSPNPSFVELSRTSSPPGLTSDLVPEVAAACHGFLLHLPGVWARPIIRAVTLQTATLHVPQRLLRAPVLFDAYAELKGEVPATLDAAAGKTTASRAVQLKSSHSTGAAPLLLQSVDLQHLLTVAPAILRYRFQDTCRIKVGEVRTGFRSNAQTASRTEASINRYAYVPHVQRDVHFGAILAQCVMRKMSPGPRLLSPGNDLGACPSHHAGEGIPRDAVQHHPPTATTVANNAQRDQRNTSLHPLTITYSAVSFEGLPSIFLKDRYDVARSENVAAGPSSAAQGGAADNSNPRHGGRRRRYIKPFFEREFVATLGSGQEDAAFFATTLAPEFMVGLPSFLKHPERAVPLSIAASLHHLYTALSVELFTRMYVGMPKHTTEAMGSDRCGGSTSAKAASGSALSTSLSPLLPPVSPTCERGGTPGLAAVAPNIHPSEPTAPSPPLRGPALELGMTYVRNTVLCSASTPGMESYIIFLHQLVYTERQGGINSTSGRKDTDRPLRRPPPSPCRAVLQLSEEANGNMSPPAMPVSAAANDGNPPPGTFTLPTIKRAAVELTQLVTWIQDEHSHNPQHGQPFLCNLTFVSTYIPNIAIPTPTSLCQPLPVMELEDSNAFPCAVVLATLDLWKALPPPAVSNLLRVCFVLDRHAQRVMELESPDYATKETPMSTAAAAEAGATDSGIPNSHGASAAVTSAIPFPDPRLRQHVATTIAGQIRTYLEGLPIFDRDDKSHRAHHHHHHHHHHQQQQQQRLLGFFMARLHYYESLNEHHCKTEKVLQHEVLQRMADKHANVSAPSTMSSPNYDVYNVKTKSICDALAAALAVEAAVNTHNNHLGRAGFGGGGVAATAPGSCWLRTASQQVHNISVSDTLDASNLDDDIAAVAKEVTASVVVLLVPQRDVQRR